MTTPVFFMHDGAVDELVCIPLLRSMPQVAMDTVWITPADCLGGPTASVSERLLELTGATDWTVCLSDSASQRPFPWTYRQYALAVDLLPRLNAAPGSAPAAARPSRTTRIRTRADRTPQAAMVHERLKRQNDRQGEPTVALVTCPLTDLAWLIEAEPAITAEIASIVWMGGTLDAPGNIDVGIAIGANPNAEWNAYWDPYAADLVLKSGIPLNLFPLDVTNLFFLTPQVLRTWFLPEAASCGMIDLVSQMYAMVAFEAGFSFWDTAAAAYLGNSALFATTPTTIAINTDEDDAAGFGCLTRTPGGVSVNVASLAGTVDDFYAYLVQQLKAFP